MTYNHLELICDDGVATVWLNRPEVHNAFNECVIDELTSCLSQLNQRNDIRVVVLAGRGKSFSAGADANWMKQAGEASFESNLEDAKRLAVMLHTLATLNKPTIARVQGAALGGGMGLACACDICVASTHAKFATSEVRLGLAPSTISPYVIQAIGERQARRYFLTAERIDAKRAYEIGLAHEICETKDIDTVIGHIINELIQGAPNAQLSSKQLIDAVANRPITDTLQHYTAQHIATIREQSEAKTGLLAFLNKTAPNW